MPKTFKTSLKQILTAEAFYDTDEFMANNWEVKRYETNWVLSGIIIRVNERG